MNIEVSDIRPGVKEDTLVATISSHTNNVPTLLIEHTKKHRLNSMNINVISLFPEIIESSLKGLTGKAFTKNHAKLMVMVMIGIQKAVLNLFTQENRLSTKIEKPHSIGVFFICVRI